MFQLRNFQIHSSCSLLVEYIARAPSLLEPRKLRDSNSLLPPHTINRNLHRDCNGNLGWLPLNQGLSHGYNSTSRNQNRICIHS